MRAPSRIPDTRISLSQPHGRGIVLRERFDVSGWTEKGPQFQIGTPQQGIHVLQNGSLSAPPSIGALLYSLSHHGVGVSLLYVIIPPGLNQCSSHYQGVPRIRYWAASQLNS